MRYVLPVLFVLAPFLFALGLTLPLMTFEKLFFFKEDPSLLSIIAVLWESNFALAILVALFSIVFPFVKMAAVTAKAQMAKDGIMRMEGCPVSVAEQLLMLCSVSGVKNPILDPENAMRFNKAYVAWRGATMAKRLKGQKYQVKGAASRGEAAPQVTAYGPGEAAPPAGEEE